MTLSSELLPEVREFERTSTTVTNAYVLPVMEQYLGRLEVELAALGSRRPDAGHAVERRRDVRGGGPPAAGPRHRVRARRRRHRHGGARPPDRAPERDQPRHGRHDGQGVGRRGRPDPARPASSRSAASSRRAAGSTRAPGFLLRVPAIDIAEIGAGGGSIVRVDDAGQLHVGPRSAGAIPGRPATRRAAPTRP